MENVKTEVDYVVEVGEGATDAVMITVGVMAAGIGLWGSICLMSALINYGVVDTIRGWLVTVGV